MGALWKLLGPEVKSLIMLSHSSPRLFALHLYTWPFIFKTLLVLQVSSGLGVESVLTVGSPQPGTGESAFLFYDPFGLREVGNHGPDAESDSAAGNVCAYTLNATWLEFSTFPFKKFYPTFQKFSTTFQKFSFTFVI